MLTLASSLLGSLPVPVLRTPRSAACGPGRGAVRGRQRKPWGPPTGAPPTAPGREGGGCPWPDGHRGRLARAMCRQSSFHLTWNLDLRGGSRGFPTYLGTGSPRAITRKSSLTRTNCQRSSSSFPCSESSLSYLKTNAQSEVMYLLIRLW